MGGLRCLLISVSGLRRCDADVDVGGPTAVESTAAAGVREVELV